MKQTRKFSYFCNILICGIYVTDNIILGHTEFCTISRTLITFTYTNTTERGLVLFLTWKCFPHTLTYQISLIGLNLSFHKEREQSFWYVTVTLRKILKLHSRSKKLNLEFEFGEVCQKYQNSFKNPWLDTIIGHCGIILSYPFNQSDNRRC